MEGGSRGILAFVYLDTHIAADLYHGIVEDLTIQARKHIESNELLIGPMVLLELGYLHQRKWVLAEPARMLAALNTTFGVNLCQIPFAAVVGQALEIQWTNDPFDRLIVAQAKANQNSKLITRDRLIRKHYPGAVW